MKAPNWFALALLTSLTVLGGCSNTPSRDCANNSPDSSNCEKAKSVEASGAGAPVTPH